MEKIYYFPPDRGRSRPKILRPCPEALVTKPCVASTTWFWGRPAIADFWGPGGPGHRETPSKRWGSKPPHLSEGFSRPPGPTGPRQIGDFRLAHKFRKPGWDHARLRGSACRLTGVTLKSGLEPPKNLRSAKENARLNPPREPRGKRDQEQNQHHL